MGVADVVCGASGAAPAITGATPTTPPIASSAMPAAADDRKRKRRIVGYIVARPTMGLLSGWPPIDPAKPASPKAKIPPSLATSQ